MTAPSPFDAAEVRLFLTHLHQPGSTFEIRIPKYGKFRLTASGYFDDVDAATAAIERWDNRASIYITLNEINPALLARAVNKILERADATTADADVLRRRWLFLDLDAVRPSGISSTDEEVAAPQAQADEIAKLLRSRGWPEPFLVASGNGAYLLYRVDLPNDDESRELVAAVLGRLAARFDSDRVKVDPTVSNASRIIGLVGTMKMKGDATGDRPHRRSRIITAPEQVDVVSRDQLESLAYEQEDDTANASSFSRTWQSGSLAEMLRAKGMEFREQAPDAKGVTWYHVRQCPFHEDGRPFECGVGQKLPDGAYAGHCFHPEGQGRGWQEFKRALGLVIDITPIQASTGSLAEICITNRHRKDIAHDAWRAVIAANDPPRLYRHGRGIAQVAREEEGRLVISHLTLPALSGHVDRCADFMKATEGGLKPARPPRDVIEDMDAMMKPLPILRGIVGTPVFGADGTLVTDAGYQSTTRLFYEPVGEHVAPVPVTPDTTHLRMAKEIILLDWLGDFPFLDDASRANTIAAVITSIAREMIAGPTPLFAIDAPSAGTGKGLLVSGIANVISGSEPPVMSEVRDENEFRKRLTAKLCEGTPLILFDNLKKRLDSATLAAVLTAEIWSDRILGGSKSADVPVRNVWICTGNNMQLTDEIARRAIWVRLDAKQDRPWEGRSFRHADLKAWVRTHRHELVWAFLVLVQNWVARGRHAWDGVVLGSYEEWSRVVGGVLENASIRGFMENREQLYARTDAVSEEWRRLIALWWEYHRTKPIAVSELFGLALEVLPTVFAKARADASERSLRTLFGNALREQRDRRFGDHFIRYQGTDRHTKAALWALESASFAEPQGGEATTSAEVPQVKRAFVGSIAEVAVVAEVDPLPPPNDGPGLVRPPVAGRSEKQVPQVPQLPQTDSNPPAIDAEPLRDLTPEEGDVPQCAICTWRDAIGLTGLGTPVCRMHAAETQRLEAKFGRAR